MLLIRRQHVAVYNKCQVSVHCVIMTYAHFREIKNAFIPLSVHRPTHRERKCADTIDTVLVLRAGHFQC